MDLIKNKKLEGSKLLTKNKRKINIAFGIWLIVNGFAFFPIKFANFNNFNEIALHLMIAYTLILVGNILKTANQNHAIKSFLYAFVLNSIGLVIRITIEYGEVSMNEALTVGNVVVYILLIPSLFTLGGLLKDIKLIKY